MSHASCHCGTVRIELNGPPIMAVECGCTSCQTAGLDFGGVLTEYRTTPYHLMRKDRVRLVAGAGQLVAHRLKPDSPTRRVVAECCGAPLYVEFEKGHWLSLYTDRVPEAERQPILCRTMTKNLPDGTDLPQDVPNPKTLTPGFILRLLWAWAAMGFRTPKIDWAREATT